MKKSLSQILDDRKRETEFRTDRFQAPFGPVQLSEAPVVYEASEKTRAVPHGGLALFHQIAVRTGLTRVLNSVPVLIRHLPYHESDHWLNIAYNILGGGTALEHIEYRRNDPVHLDMLGTHSIPDPTTAGDFCRRFSRERLDRLQDRINEVRKDVWKRQSQSFFKEARVDVDGLIAPTYGECKQGMDISYKGIWGYHPLLVSLSNTKEILYVMNRSGNRPSHEGAHVYLDKAIKVLREAGFQIIRLRGDTDFTQTAHLDRWDAQGVVFVFGIDAMAKLVKIAESLEIEDWTELSRPAKYEVKTTPRGRRENIKEKIVEERGYRNISTFFEHAAEVRYRPGKCGKEYRLVILSKTLTVKEGQRLLLPEVRYFFYLTNDWDQSKEEIIAESNSRCDQENLIGQLKSGFHATKMPLDDLESNWAYMIGASLAWTLKAWSALILPGPADDSRKKRLLGMEFATFLQAMVMIPAQILTSGRRIVVRFLNVNEWTETFFRLNEALRHPLRE